MKQNIFDDLRQSMKEAVQIAKGEAAPSRAFTVEAPDVKAIREQTGLSQTEFARLLRVNLKTLQNWEQHRRTPTGAAAALLTVFEHEPEAALRALHQHAA
jgi:putative transcriptional regulator